MKAHLPGLLICLVITVRGALGVLEDSFNLADAHASRALGVVVAPREERTRSGHPRRMPAPVGGGLERFLPLQSVLGLRCAVLHSQMRRSQL